MCETHQDEIEFLRKNIELITITPSDSIEENPENKNEKNNIEFITAKGGKKVVIDDDEEEEDYINNQKNLNINNNIINEKDYDEIPNYKKEQIEKTFDEAYNIYQKDIKYFCDQRAKEFKEIHYDSFEYKAMYFPKRKKNRFDFNEIFDEIEKNGHQSRYEAPNEEDFISSDSYDTDLIDLKTNVNKNYKIKTRQNLMDNKDNLNEIVRVIKICKDRDVRIDGNY